MLGINWLFRRRTRAGQQSYSQANDSSTRPARPYRPAYRGIRPLSDYLPSAVASDSATRPSSSTSRSHSTDVSSTSSPEPGTYDWLIQTCRQLGIDTEEVLTSVRVPALPPGPQFGRLPQSNQRYRTEIDYQARLRSQREAPGSYRPGGFVDAACGHLPTCHTDGNPPGSPADLAAGHSPDRCGYGASILDRASIENGNPFAPGS